MTTQPPDAHRQEGGSTLPFAVGQTLNTVVLQAERLSCWFGDRAVFTQWSVQIGPGLTWLRGPNGSGKSTLLRLFAGALQPQAGALRVRDLDAAAQPIAYRREVFWCGPDPIAFDHLRPAEYFGFLRTLYPRFDADLAMNHAAALGLGPHMRSRIAALSTGTQRKVALTAALCAGTAAVLMDEPFNALDAGSLVCFQDLLNQATQRENSAWLVASHEAPLSTIAAVVILQAQ